MWGLIPCLIHRVKLNCRAYTQGGIIKVMNNQEKNNSIEQVQPTEMELISLKSIETTIDRMEELKKQVEPHIALEGSDNFTNALAALALYEKAAKIQTEAIAKYVSLKNSNIQKEKMEITKENISRKTKTITITEESIPKKRLKSMNLEDILDIED